ncbi:DUF58 domain-containing protein [Aestuariimicrobium ganziense]|uniref:DUF58 domain-containing protein n=1 Tax=Aestuariimicrobium ganziense TaxID=2773677 RepID=UPI001944E1E1|nr:DUF58 domain-containing protein [Aestuariimicrobium ganziense]
MAIPSRPPEPTSALTRSWSAAVVLLLLAVLFGRPGVALLAVPLAVHAAWAWWRRPRLAPALRTRPRTSAIPEGDGVDLTVAVDEPEPATWLSVQWPGIVGAAWDPKHGAAVDLADQGVSVGLEPERWGRYVTGAPGIQYMDESGSWRSTIEGESCTVTVRPAAATLSGGSGVARPIGLTGAHTSSVRGDGTQIADIREYRAGDRLRRINWRVTSRTQKLHVTQTFTERDTDVLIVADTLRDLPDPSGTSSSLDATVRAIAAISQHYVGFGDRVAVHDLGHRIGLVRPGTGPRQVRIILEMLSRSLRDVPDHLSMRRVPSLRPGTLVFVCSPLLDQKVTDELNRLRQYGGEVIVVDTMPETLGTFGAIRHDTSRSFLAEAWLVRRMQREVTVRRIEELGVPVTPWQGTASLASVLLAMQAARTAPRRAVGR